MNRMFDEIAAGQGWDYSTVESILRDFIAENGLEDDLVEYAEGRATNDQDSAPQCPSCRSDDWDFLVNDDAVCRDCGHRWTVPVEDEEND